MKLKFRPAVALLMGASCLALPSYAYEWENAVPLTLGIQMNSLSLDGVHIKLNGHEADIAISLRNSAKQPQHVGFYATTPLFESHGEGEDYADKTFPDLKVLQDGNAIRVSRTHRAYFLGQDVTQILRKAGVDPVPSNGGDWRKKARLPLLQNLRLQDWQGQVSFGWTTRIAADSTAVGTVKYTALPWFGLQGLDSDYFARLVQQHCGSPEEMRNLVHRAAPAETEVMAETFQFPLPFLNIQDTRLTVERASRRWQGTRPIAVMACGYNGPLAIPSDGEIKGANNFVSILVVSLLDGAPEEEGDKQ